MTYNLAPFLTGFALSAALIMAIGAQNLFVLRQGLSRQHVGPIVLFCGAADALLITAGVSGLGAFLAALPQLADLLAIAGAGFLGWYGLRALGRLRAGEAMAVAQGEGVTLPRALAATAAFTLLNPHVYLDTVLLMGTAGSAQPVELRPLFIAGAVAASFCWFTALGYGARMLTPLFARPAAWRVLDGLMGLTMLALAASLVWRVVG
ncbi:LysE family transporter [Niveispirillum sp. BGYR6]|uniref:LysE/ArgO family amino acid transporter n=1 Tax=Niveispirillum sp. BGYR6 TaxID=2971249 RepID=UPI0022B95A37|nr:LysE family transporter [Niveispirillum sp. BGYR6]MDG5497277.1 LysE family transporter [Niveispirillum sp. BGYR6]